MDRDRVDILLKEYEICQKESDGSARNYWTTFGIFTSLSTAVIGGVIAVSIKSENNTLSPVWLGFLLIFSFIVFAVLYFLYSWFKRVTHFIGANTRRMREIEDELGMNRSIRIWILDHWDELCERHNNNLPLKIVKNDISKYLIEVPNTLEFISENEKVELSKFKTSIPKKYRPPRTGFDLLSGLFPQLFAWWAIIILFTVGLLIYNCLN